MDSVCKFLDSNHNIRSHAFKCNYKAESPSTGVIQCTAASDSSSTWQVFLIKSCFIIRTAFTDCYYQFNTENLRIFITEIL